MIGILGGTFDPIHVGHLVLAKKAKDQFHLGTVLFVPTFIPPHKLSKRDITPAPYRCKMVEIAIQGHPSFRLCEVEMMRADISYTVETLRLLKQQYPQDELRLIIGEDSLEEMPTWREPDEIKRLVHLLVAPRSKSAAGRKIEERLSWIDMSLCPISSSEIREKNKAK